MPKTKSSLIGASQFLNSGLSLKLNAQQKKELGDGPKFAKLTNLQKILKDDKKVTGLVGKLKVAQTPEAWAKAVIHSKWQSLGGARGFLGKASTPVKSCPDGEGFFQHYKGGSIYFHPDTGAHEVHGAIRGHWASHEWERGFLGYPVSDELKGRDEKQEGRYSQFQGGQIYWHQATGAHEVHGSILEKYRELGEEASFLGYPTTDCKKTPDPRGRFNHFQGGSIYWTNQTGAHEVHGLIRGYWAENGWERNDELGFPLTDELVPDRNAGGVRPNGITTIAHAGIKLKTGAFKLNQPIGVSGDLAESLNPMTVNSPAMADAISKPRKKTSAKTTVTSAAAMTLDKNRILANAIRNVAGVRSVTQESMVGTSPNRFSDFESGVLFWHRGDKSAFKLKPWTRTKSGKSMVLSRNQVLAKVSNTVKELIERLPRGLKFQSLGIEPTATSYRFDGIRPLNREHRIQISMTAQAQSGGRWVSTQLKLLLYLMIEHDPFTDHMVATWTRFSWKRYRRTVRFIENVDFEAHKVFDPQLWKPFTFLTIPKSDSGRRITVLSVKTQENGRVEIYVEPEKLRIPSGKVSTKPVNIKPVTNVVLRNPDLIEKVKLKQKLIRP